MKCISLLALLLGLLIATSQLSAQSGAVESSVKQLFSKPEKIVWVKHYSGRLDDLNDVTVTLAYDGKHCKGQIRHLKSREIYGLAGFIKKDKIRLQEVNQDEQISGFIEGNINKASIVGNWSKYDNSIGKSLILKESKKPLSIPTNCGDNKWVRTFNGTIDSKDVELMLQLESDSELKGVVYFYSLDQSFEVEGAILNNNKLALRIYDANAFLKGVISGYVSDKGIIDAGYTGEGGKQQMVSFWEQSKLHVACVEYADYFGSYDITYPKSKSSAFNQWVSGQSIVWLNECRERIQKVNEQNKVLDLEKCASIRAYAWCDLDYVSPQIISGTLLMNSTWSKETELVGFNFNLTTNQKIELNDIFKKDFDYQQMIWEYLGEDVKKHKYYSDYNFRKWLSAESFNQFAIRHDGINFSTSFNSIYGQQKVTIPYEILAPHLKKKSPVWAFVPEGLSRM